MGCDYFVKKDEITIRVIDYNSEFGELPLKTIKVNTENVDKLQMEIDGVRSR